MFLYSLLTTIVKPIIYLRYEGELPNINNYKPNIMMSLPCVGQWYILIGGYEKPDSHSWNILSQRYAYDLIKIDNHGKRYKNNKYILEDHYAYDQWVISPSDGIVVDLRDNVNDNKILDISLQSKIKILGNYILIKHKRNMYSLIAHLKYKSVIVKKGDRVKSGEYIAKTGNSGLSYYPHIHYQMQDSRSLVLSMGLPILFKDVRIVNKYLTINKHKLIKNNRVRNA